MNDLLAKFTSLSSGQKAGVLAAAAVLILGGAFYFFVGDNLSKAETLDEKIDTQAATIDELAGKARHLDRYKQVIESLRIQLREAEEQLPKKAEIEKLLRDVAYEAQQSGLALERFALSAESKGENFAKVPVEMKVRGGYHELAVFFDRMSKMQRIVNIGDLQMSDPALENKKVTLTAEYQLTTYRFLEPDERTVKKKKKKKKKKKATK